MTTSDLPVMPDGLPELPPPPAPVGLRLHHANGVVEAPKVTYEGPYETSNGIYHGWRVHADFTPGMRISATHLPLGIRLFFRVRQHPQVTS